MKTNSGLIEYAKKQIGRPYWWGTFGQIGSASLHAAKRRQYPSYYTAADFPSQYGKKVHDCAGLVKGYLWSDGPDAPAKYNAAQDKSAAGLYKGAKIKGKVGTFDYIPGRLIFKGKTPDAINHVGVYVGGGYVVEAKGHAYGVVTGSFNPAEWTFWCQCEYITCDTSQNVAVIHDEYNAGPAVTLNGVDISDVQLKKGLDLPAFYEAHPEIDFWIIKCTRGASSVNDSFKPWADFLTEKGACWAGYHFLNNDKAQAGSTKEADFYLSYMAPYIGKAVLALDYEDPEMGFAAGEAYAEAWLMRVKLMTGVTPIIYTQQSRVNKLGRIHAAGFPLWVAKYGKNPERDGFDAGASIPASEIAPYTKPVIFQYSSNAHFAGYDDDIDVNVFYGTKEDWRAMAAVRKQEYTSVTAELPVLKQGSSGRAVKVWQTIAGAKTDGVFGPATAAATRAYQADNDLSTDGIVGPKTWKHALEGLKHG